ncbi:MAG: hypothetical protein ABIF71_15785 [Planctomycetota bacterium]
MAKKNLILGTVLALVLALTTPVCGDETNGAGWFKMEYGSVTLFVANDANLGKLFGNLRNFKADTDSTLAKDAGIRVQAEALARRVDAIFNAVREASGFDVTITGHERVVVLKDYNALQAMFKKIYGREYPEGISFYCARMNTVFTTENAMSGKILAHEFTHMVVDLQAELTLTMAENEEFAYKMETVF